MTTEEHLLFIERVARSLRGDLPQSELDELRVEIECNPAKRAESVQLMETYDLLSLCAATDSPPREVPDLLFCLGPDLCQVATTDVPPRGVPHDAIRLLRLEVEKHIKPKPAKWRFGPAAALWASGIAAVLVFGFSVIEQSQPPVDGLLVVEQTQPPVEPVLEYALEAGSTNNRSILNPFSGRNKGEPFESVLKRTLKDTTLQIISSANGQDWEHNWPESDMQPVFKLLIQEHDGNGKFKSDFGLIKVMGRWRGANFQKTFPITTPDGLPTALKEAQSFIEETIQRH